MNYKNLHLKKEFHPFLKLSVIKDDIIAEEIEGFSNRPNELEMDIEKQLSDILNLKFHD